MKQRTLQALMVLLALWSARGTATAETYSIDSYTIDGGGGVAAGGGYSLNGTVGQPDAGRSSGGSFALAGGFWGTSPLSFAVWIAGYGLSGPAAAPGADPDGDQVTNAGEYVLGGDPTVADPSHGLTATSAGGSLTLSFLRADPAETQDVTLALELGTDLVTWPVVFTIGPNTASSSPGVAVTENGFGPDLVTVTVPVGLSQRLFARLHVTIAP
jgi:hypothetical protein